MKKLDDNLRLGKLILHRLQFSSAKSFFTILGIGMMVKGFIDTTST